MNKLTIYREDYSEMGWKEILEDLNLNEEGGMIKDLTLEVTKVTADRFDCLPTNVSNVASGYITHKGQQILEINDKEYDFLTTAKNEDEHASGCYSANISVSHLHLHYNEGVYYGLITNGSSKEEHPLLIHDFVGKLECLDWLVS